MKDIGRIVQSYFTLPNEYSSSIILTDSDFILTDMTCAKTRNRGPGSFAIVDFADTREVFTLLGYEADGEAARGP